MGAGIAEVFARQGYAVVGVERDEEGLERGRRHLENSTGRAVKREKMTEDGAGRPDRADHLHHLAQGPDRRRLRRRSGRGVDGAEEVRSSASSTTSSAPTPILATNTSSLSVTELSTANSRPGSRHRCPLLQPGPRAGPGRDRATVVTEDAVLERREGPGRSSSARTRDLRRQGRLHRQHPALRLPQPRRLDVREPLRLPRGHRRRHALRLRLPDGPARPGRPDRPRHGVRDPRDDVPPGPRPTARALADPQADGDRGPARVARPDVASTPTRRPTARSSWPTRPRRRPTSSRSSGTTSSRSVWSAPAPWPPASSRSSPRAGTTCCTSVARRTRSTAWSRRSSKSLDKAIQRGRARGVGKAEVLGRLTGSTSLDDLSARRHRRRGDRRGPQGQDDAVREPRRDLQARGDPGDHHLVAADHRLRPGDSSARRTWSACTSSTRRRS